jgi:hypothetical protein
MYMHTMLHKHHIECHILIFPSFKPLDSVIRILVLVEYHVDVY